MNEKKHGGNGSRLFENVKHSKIDFIGPKLILMLSPGQPNIGSIYLSFGQILDWSAICSKHQTRLQCVLYFLSTKAKTN